MLGVVWVLWQTRGDIDVCYGVVVFVREELNVLFVTSAVGQENKLSRRKGQNVRIMD